MTNTRQHGRMVEAMEHEAEAVALLELVRGWEGTDLVAVAQVHATLALAAATLAVAEADQ